MISKEKPIGFNIGFRYEEGDLRPCGKCGKLTNYYQHDFMCGFRNEEYISVTKCKECYTKEAKMEEWKNEHYQEDSTICPWCEYEFDFDEEEYDEQDSEECDCPRCGKTFLRTVEIKRTYTTWKDEDDYQEGE